MLTEKAVLDALDNSVEQGCYCSFIDLGHVYSYLIDARLNIFRGEDERWAIAAERLGYTPRAGGILLDIYYFGNCLINLENYNGQDTNSYSVTPVEWSDFQETLDGEALKPTAKHWRARGQNVNLSHNKQDYANAGIELKECSPDEISAEEVGRLAVEENRQLFRATDAELYKSIPSGLRKILVLDQWYHRDFMGLYKPHTSDYEMGITYELSKQHYGEENFMDYESFAAQHKREEQKRYEESLKRWQQSRPSAYETWQMAAKVIVTGDTSLYKPTLQPNTHWRFWPESGTF